MAPELRPVLDSLVAPEPALEAMPLTQDLRERGYHECFPPDPMGWGPYAPPRNLSIGRIAIPLRGGHTPDMGFDVLIHFHGMEPLRKTLVQVARGVALVGIDLGIGSGAYSDAFQSAWVFPTLLRSVESALRKHTGDSRAHIRNLALTAWSAGYGAINEILKRGDDAVDAVVLLDALHAGWNQTGVRGSARGVSGAYVAPILDFARRARDAERTFIFTHSNVDPVTYPSTRLTADYLLAEFGLERQPLSYQPGFFSRRSTVDVGGLHVWAYGGNNEDAHCAHIFHISQILRELLEKQWDTPPMDRSMVKPRQLT